MPIPTDTELHVLASLLRRGRSIDGLSTGLALLGAWVGLTHLERDLGNSWLSNAGFALLGLGVLQKYWAMRTAFDADLLQRIADSSRPLADSTERMDQALARLGLQSFKKARRPWPDRKRGALKLLYRQVAIVLIQITFTLGLILAFPWILDNG